MIDIQKVKGYKSAFTRLSNNPENNFEKYLQTKNLTVIDFLLQVGMNPEIIKAYNYEEIEKIAEKSLTSNGFPELSHPLSEEMKMDPLYIHNKLMGNDVVITNDGISFEENNLQTIDDKNYHNNVETIIYNLINDNIQKKVVSVSYITDSMDLPSPITKNIKCMKVVAKEEIFNKDGKIICEGSYSFSINTPLNTYTFTKINRSLDSVSITNCIYTVIELIAAGKLKREDVDFELNIANLQKK